MAFFLALDTAPIGIALFAIMPNAKRFRLRRAPALAKAKRNDRRAEASGRCLHRPRERGGEARGTDFAEA